MLNIVVPMAGRGSRFTSAHFSHPKPLIPIIGRPMIAWIIDNIRPRRDHRFIFICLEEHLRAHPEVSEVLRHLCPGCEVRSLNAVTEGAACTVLTVADLIDSPEPLMIANSDQYVALDIDEYMSQGDASAIDGFMMTFWADDPKWSYCRMRPDGTVMEVVEKQVVSNEATVGIYSFARGSDFVRATESMIGKDLRVNGEFYVAPTYNEMIARGARITVVRTGREYDGMHGLGTPQDLAHFMTTDLFMSVLTRSRQELIARTTTYAKAFGRRDLGSVATMLTHDVVLMDPAGRFEGHEARAYIEKLLTSNPDLTFEPKRIEALSDTQSLIEFHLSVGGKTFDGADVLEWCGGQISEIRAYLHERPVVH
jgi:dTDP-glucose pyrophosphorylase